MEMKPNCKQTDLGVIPEDWEVRRISAVCKLINGRGFKPFEWQRTGLPIIRIQNLNGSDDFNFYSGIYDRKLEVQPGQLLFAWSGSRGTSFGPFIWKGPIGLLNYHTWKVQIHELEIGKDFLFHALKQLTGFIEGWAHGASALVHVQKWQMEGFQLALPSTKAEQEAIAEALSEADALIESLEQLIAKKRHVKQGTMQELLRPKDGWESTSLGSIADPNQQWSFTGGPFGSNLKSSDYADEGVRIIQLQNIGDGEFKDDYEIYTSSQKADELLSCNIYPGEIILSKMGDPVARACIVPSLGARFLMCSDGIRLAVDQRRFNIYFILTVINGQDFRTKAANAGTGSTRKRIGLTELRNLELVSPLLPKQTTIATILRDMDTEIAGLETKLTKARQLKQGMMQELLIGRIRLV